VRRRHDELNNDLATEDQALVKAVRRAAAITGSQRDAIKADGVVHSNEWHASPRASDSAPG